MRGTIKGVPRPSQTWAIVNEDSLKNSSKTKRGMPCMFSQISRSRSTITEPRSQPRADSKANRLNHPALPPTSAHEQTTNTPKTPHHSPLAHHRCPASRHALRQIDQIDKEVAAGKMMTVHGFGISNVPALPSPVGKKRSIRMTTMTTNTHDRELDNKADGGRGD